MNHFSSSVPNTPFRNANVYMHQAQRAGQTNRLQFVPIQTFGNVTILLLYHLEKQNMFCQP